MGKLVVRLVRKRARMVTLRDMFGNVLIDVCMLEDVALCYLIETGQRYCMYEV